MDPTKNWVPVKWPQGPFWTQPASLDLLKGTPLNTLVLPWGSDSTANEALRPLLAAGKERNLNFAAAEGANVESARAAGLAVIPLTKRADLATAKGPVAVFTENVWPSVRVAMRGSFAAADAGPTGIPWIDTNGWFAQLAQTLHPEVTAWIAADPPAKQVISRPHAYIVAIADAAMVGARCVVSLDDAFAGALAQADTKALGDWKRITTTLEFFEAHRDWQAYRPVGVAGVVSDFAGDNEFLSTECLNLIGRRMLPYRILDKKKFAPASLAGLKAVVYPDDDLPQPAVRQALVAFARAGGLLLVTKRCAALAAGMPVGAAASPVFEMHQAGTGRIGVALEDAPDPYLLANEMHMLLSRRNDLFRIYNFGASTVWYQGSADGKKVLFQYLNFTSGSTPDMSVEFVRPYKSARCWTPEKPAAAPLEFIKRESSMEVHLPSFAEYCAIELEA